MKTPKTKPCARCKEVLPAASFDLHPRATSGLHSYCKPCRKARNAERPNYPRPKYDRTTSETPKECVSCHRMLEPSQYMSNVNSSDGLRSRCKACTSSTQILRKYHLTSDQYAELAKNGCRICGSYEKLHVDHDHACCPRADSGSAAVCGKCIRGILCSMCNRGLGFFRDNPVYLEGAIEYLRST